MDDTPYALMKEVIVYIKIERRLNRYNIFDFDYTPSENDHFFYMKMKMISPNFVLKMNS